MGQRCACIARWNYFFLAFPYYRYARVSTPVVDRARSRYPRASSRDYWTLFRLLFEYSRLHRLAQLHVSRFCSQMRVSNAHVKCARKAYRFRAFPEWICRFDIHTLPFHPEQFELFPIAPHSPRLPLLNHSLSLPLFCFTRVDPYAASANVCHLFREKIRDFCAKLPPPNVE